MAKAKSRQQIIYHQIQQIIYHQIQQIDFSILPYHLQPSKHFVNGKKLRYPSYASEQKTRFSISGEKSCKTCSEAAQIKYRFKYAILRPSICKKCDRIT
ncbi:hypothetical protein KFK09_012090 [Dendrobium nobile]|uniref:Uncharacterized protein n=1 Tax=Dendrobium nobile TaxID=94219 RepID=A0A8T3BGP0_DENNO|nr:hypothetical protein KFK09_012090 [Dendrobium nobile]